jgi:Fe-S-cluster containining protein
MSDKHRHAHHPAAATCAIPATPLERFVREIYAVMDRGTSKRLVRLDHEDGVQPSCRAGCSHCCQHYILTNRAEAHTLGQYVKREFSHGQLRALRTRTRRWHEWEALRAGRSVSRRGALRSQARYVHRCPLLVASRCSAYPARPAICRTHFVSSPPQFCRDANDPTHPSQPPRSIAAVVETADPLVRSVRAQIESAGFDYTRSILLLPHWLATEMGWDFSSRDNS